MPYLDIPLPGDAINVSQGQIRGNFALLGAMLSPDLRIIKLNNLPGAAPVPAANQLEIYAKTNLAGNPTLFWNSVASGEIDMTTELSAPVGGLEGETGFTVLPSGVIMKWGTLNIGNNTQTIYAFPVGGVIPAFARIFTLQLTCYGTAATLNGFYWSDFNPLGFTAAHHSTARNFTYLAIGI